MLLTNLSVRGSRATLDEQLRSQIAKLETVAQHLVEGSFEASTDDNQDHTFSGIMFPVECRENLPVEFVEIKAVAVRGDLGPVSVYTCNYDPNSRTHLVQVPPSQWERRFGPRDLSPSRRAYVDLIFDRPLRLAPGQCAGIYVHSELDGDRAIVYDNQRHSDYTYSDAIIAVRPGIAHTSNEAFSAINHLWGGIAWRPRREFVGRIKYGTKFLLWTPIAHARFPSSFRTAVLTLLCSHHVLGTRRLREPSLGDVPIDVVFRVLNFLPHDWFGEEEVITDVERVETEPARGIRASEILSQFGLGFQGFHFLLNQAGGGEEEDDDEDDPDWEEEDEDDEEYDEDDDEEDADVDEGM